MTTRKSSRTGSHRAHRAAPSQGADLRGRVAVVTGGGRGFGRAFAVGLAASGAAVAVVARSVDQITGTVAEITGAGGRGLAVAVDVTNDTAVERMARRVESEIGPVDLLINNAGMGPPYGPVHEIDAEEWWRCVEVNLRGPLLCARAFLPQMTARRCGRIVNVASASGTVPVPHLSAYAVSKAALIRLTEILALESREHGIAVFAIEPGTLRSRMTESAISSAEGRKWLPWLGRIFEEGRDVGTERALDLVLKLASGRADALSGRFVTIEDDLDAMVGRAREIERDDLYTLKLRTPV